VKGSTLYSAGCGAEFAVLYEAVIGPLGALNGMLTAKAPVSDRCGKRRRAVVMSAKGRSNYGGTANFLPLHAHYFAARSVSTGLRRAETGAAGVV
jgi:hypothetical protein